MRTFIVAAALAVLAAPVQAQTSPAVDQGVIQGPLSSATKTFVADAAMTGMFAIAAGRLALKRADGPAYLDVAQLMIADHSTISTQLKRLVSGAPDVQLPLELDRAHRAKVDQLGSLSGAAFERQYKAEQLQGQRRAIEMFQTYVESGDNPDLKGWAARRLTTLKAHLQHAEALPDPGPAPTTGSEPGTR